MNRPTAGNSGDRSALRAVPIGPTYVEMPILQDVNLDYDALAIEANDISAVLDIMPGVVLVQINSVNVEVIVEDVQ